MHECDYTLDDSLAFLASFAEDKVPEDILKGLRQYQAMVRSAYARRRIEAGQQLRYRGHLAMCRRLGNKNAVTLRLPFECKIRNKQRTMTMAKFQAREARRARVAKVVAALGADHG